MVCENCRNDDLECEFCEAMTDENKKQVKHDAKTFVDLLMDPNCDFVTVVEHIPNYSKCKAMDEFREEVIEFLKKEN